MANSVENMSETSENVGDVYWRCLAASEAPTDLEHSSQKPQGWADCLGPTDLSTQRVKHCEPVLGF